MIYSHNYGFKWISSCYFTYFYFFPRLLGMPAAYQTSLELKPTTYQTYCRKLQYLVERQRELCGMNPNILQTVGRGAKMGIDECQHQFRMSRWNCTTFSNSSTVFGGVMDVRE
ncbi:UNVERIFIED_CONTAM: wnt2b-a [Trichonephila clavipes]